MTKFIVATLCAILAVQHIEGLDMGRCAQLAIAKGVPELGIPSHDPLVLEKNITFQLDTLFGNNFSFVMSNFTWTNVPWWNVRKNEVIKTTTQYFDVYGELWWDNFTVSFDYFSTWGVNKFQGNVEYLYKDITWEGSYQETRPDHRGIRKLNYFNIKQTVGQVTVKKTGLDALGIFGDAILYGANDFVSEKLVNKHNFFGNAFLNKINKVWYGNLTVYNTLVKWCKDRNVTMQLY